MENPWGVLYFYPFEAKFTAVDRIELPYYSGSTVRGGLGRALRKVACVPLCKSPQTCLLGSLCPYFYAFESQRNDAPAGLRNYPHPFVLEPVSSSIVEQGSEFSFGFILVGNSIRILPYFIYAFIQMGQMGIGKNHGKFNLISVVSRPSGKVVYQPERGVIEFWGDRISPSKIHIGRRVRLSFLTPTRLKIGGIYEVAPRFESLVRAGLRRMSLLARGYCDAELRLRFDELIEMSRGVRIVNEMTNMRIIKRFSSRQKAKVPMYGFTGIVEYEGDLPSFGELLDALRWLHIGGATSFGFGKVEIITPSQQ